MYGHENILFLFYNIIYFIVRRLSRLSALGEPYSLSFVVHVTSLLFLRLREMFAHIFDIYE